MKEILIEMIRVFFNNMTGKYAKQTLQRLEDQNLLSKEVRKCVLDGFNDFSREVNKRLDSMKL